MSPAPTLAARVAEVRARIARACERAGRDPASVRLVAVSKTHDVEAVREALEAGIEDFGENRAQELVPKAEAARADGLAPRWHFVGHLQRNKARDVWPHIASLHSLDSERLIEAVERLADVHREAPGGGHVLPCYIEVNVAGEAQKQGVEPSALPALLRRAADSPAIDVVGLMTVAPQAADPEAVRPVFRSLRALAEAHGVRGLSMGMTEDFEIAIEEGATLVRVGRAIFGERR
jgi:PLP dependent protein